MPMGVERLARAGAVARLVEPVGDGAQAHPGVLEQPGQLGGLLVVDVGQRVGPARPQPPGPRVRGQVGRRAQDKFARFLGGQCVAVTSGNGGCFLLGDSGQDVQGELGGCGQVHLPQLTVRFHWTILLSLSLNSLLASPVQCFVQPIGIESTAASVQITP